MLSHHLICMCAPLTWHMLTGFRWSWLTQMHSPLPGMPQSWKMQRSGHHSSSVIAPLERALDISPAYAMGQSRASTRRQATRPGKRKREEARLDAQGRAEAGDIVDPEAASSTTVAMPAPDTGDAGSTPLAEGTEDSEPACMSASVVPASSCHMPDLATWGVCH